MEEQLLMMYEENMANDEKLLLLLEENERSNLHNGLPYWKYDRFSLEDMREDEYEVEMRFKKNDIYNLACALRLPEVYRCYNGLVVDSVEALCICLKRFAYPCRYADLVSTTMLRPRLYLFIYLTLAVNTNINTIIIQTRKRLRNTTTA